MSLEIRSKQENKQESWLVASGCNQQTASNQIATYLVGVGRPSPLRGDLLPEKKHWKFLSLLGSVGDSCDVSFFQALPSLQAPYMYTKD